MNATEPIRLERSYEHRTVVELTPAGDGVSVVMTVEPLQDRVWTERLVAGRSNGLDNPTAPRSDMNRGDPR